MSFETPLPPYNVSDPYATFLNASCMDLLLIEMVPMTYRIANELSVPDEDGAKPIDEDEQRDAAFRRLETLGYRVGQGLAERCVACRFPLAQLGYEKFVVRLWQVEMATAVVARAMLTSNTSADRFSRDRPRFTDTLDVIKFLCKDLWTLVFRKQVDNLKTNHRGVYVLTDNSFKPFSRMSMASSSEAVLRAQPFLWFPCGIIRGGLASMGINATVQAETSELPAATFQIKTIVAKP